MSVTSLCLSPSLCVFCNPSHSLTDSFLPSFLPSSSLAAAHAPLRARLDALTQLRDNHNRLRNVITKVLRSAAFRVSAAAAAAAAAGAAGTVESGGGGKEDHDDHDGNAVAATGEVYTYTLNKVDNAYRTIVSGCDVLDLSAEGEERWRRARQAYASQIDRVEVDISRVLTGRLSRCRSSAEMFRVFAAFNSLFYRARIRGAIQQFQARLVAQVRVDVQRLQRKFMQSYSTSEARVMSGVLDIPEVSGAIIWARQIARQLQTYMVRVEAVLGHGWEQHPEGRKLKEMGDRFMQKLDTTGLFSRWLDGVKAKGTSLELTGRVLVVRKGSGSSAAAEGDKDKENRRKKGSGENEPRLRLCVNFDPATISLFKEVRNMQWLALDQNAAAASAEAKAAAGVGVGVGVGRESKSKLGDGIKEKGAGSLLSSSSLDGSGPDLSSAASALLTGTGDAAAMLSLTAAVPEGLGVARIPYTIRMISDEAREKYPSAVALSSLVAAYEREVGSLVTRPNPHSYSDRQTDR